MSRLTRPGSPSRLRPHSARIDEARVRPRYFNLVALALCVPYFENPIHRPPAPTPNHNASDTSATSFSQGGRTRPSSAVVTFVRTVNVKTIARARHVIFTAKGVLL